MEDAVIVDPICIPLIKTPKVGIPVPDVKAFAYRKESVLMPLGIFAELRMPVVFLIITNLPAMPVIVLPEVGPSVRAFPASHVKELFPTQFRGKYVPDEAGILSKVSVPWLKTEKAERRIL